MSGVWAKVVTRLARQRIAEAMGVDYPAVDVPDSFRMALLEPGATFVTIKENGSLRGCIGSLEARRPLQDDLTANAVAAAFHDPRFAPLGPDEFDRIDIEVSILTPIRRLVADSEQAVIAQLRPGVDGVVLALGTHRATFLPQVWDELPDPSVFLAHLRDKAGIPQGVWDPEIQVSTYQVNRYREEAGNE